MYSFRPVFNDKTYLNKMFSLMDLYNLAEYNIYFYIFKLINFLMFFLIILVVTVLY